MADTFRMFAARVTSTVAVSLVNLGTTSTAIMRSLTICNTHTSATASVDISIERTPETAEYLVQRYTQVDSQATVEPITTPMVLSGGDVLKVTANTGNVDAIASILETS